VEGLSRPTDGEGRLHEIKTLWPSKKPPPMDRFASDGCSRGQLYLWCEAWLRRVLPETVSNKSDQHMSTKSNPVLGVRVEILETEELPLWDAFVATHPDGCIYHLSKWKEILENSFPHIRGHFLAVKDNRTGEIVAGLPIYAVRSWLLGNRLVSVPFSSYCDPLLSVEHGWNVFLPKISELLKQCRANTLQLRPSGSTKVTQLPDLERSSLYFHHFINLDEEPEQLKKRLSRTCVRQWLSRAERNQITIERGHTQRDLERVYAMLTETRRRHCLPPIPLRFFESLRRALQPSHLDILTAWHAGKPVAGALALKYRDTFILEYAGDTAAGRNTGASQRLYWEAVKLAHSEHFSRFSFGRTSVLNTGLTDYKKRWGTVEEELPILTLVTHGSHCAQYQDKLFLCRLAQAVLRRCPELTYRPLGEFCYRHWG